MKKALEYIAKFHFWRSFRNRIFILMLVVGMVPGIIVQNAILHNYEDRAVSVKTSEVQNQFMIIASHLLVHNYLQDTSSEVINAELEQLSTLYDGRVLIVNGNFNIIKDTYGISQGKTMISQEVMKGFKGEISTQYDPVNRYIELTIPITETVKPMAEMPPGDMPPENVLTTSREEITVVRGVMVTSVSTEYITMTMDILGRKALLIYLFLCVLIFILSVVISRFLTKPFHKVSSAIKEVREGYSNEALSVPDYVETQHIVESFNQVLGRMRMLDESRQEFVSNVSHELKTPLTSMKVLADSLNMQTDAPVELYREFMQDIAAEIDRENQIINDLLSLVKLDKTNAELNIEAVSVNDLIELILKRLRPIARKRNVEVIFESMRPVTAEIDEVKVTLAISNLVENAIKYNKEQGWVKVVLDADHQYFSLLIEDSGIGIPEESYEHIFERFYREDKSHSREVGGTGLGLAIARNIVLMHRGTINVTSVMGEGTVFTVKIPLTNIK